MDQQTQLYVQQAITNERKRIADAVRQTVNMHLSTGAIFNKYGDDYQKQANMLRDVLQALERNFRGE